MKPNGGFVHPEEVFALTATLLIVTGAVVLVVSMIQRGRLREMAHKERLARIERGLAPPPEVDPASFERAMGQPTWDERVVERSARYRRAGVIVMALGAGLWMIIGFAAGEPAIAFGIGGAIFVLGLALYFNSEMELRHASRTRRTSTSQQASHPEP
jgi:hypothetical protein